jgi:hypothetical protein
MSPAYWILVGSAWLCKSVIPVGLQTKWRFIGRFFVFRARDINNEYDHRRIGSAARSAAARNRHATKEI